MAHVIVHHHVRAAVNHAVAAAGERKREVDGSRRRARARVGADDDPGEHRRGERGDDAEHESVGG
jgi:hypothetical protein